MPHSSAAGVPGSTPEAGPHGLGAAVGEPVLAAGRAPAPPLPRRASSTTHAPAPRTSAAGTPSALPFTRSAAAASSSAIARGGDGQRAAVGVGGAAQVVEHLDPGRAQGEVGLPRPPGPARRVAEHHAQPRAARPPRAGPPAGARACASGSAGSRSSRSVPPVLEASTPAAAITGPGDDWTIRVTRSPDARSATTRRVCDAITASRSRRCPPTGRGPWRRPCSRRRARRRRPGARRPRPRRPRRARRRSSPACTSGIPAERGERDAARSALPCSSSGEVERGAGDVGGGVHVGHEQRPAADGQALVRGARPPRRRGRRASRRGSRRRGRPPRWWSTRRRWRAGRRRRGRARARREISGETPTTGARCRAARRARPGRRG